MGKFRQMFAKTPQHKTTEGESARKDAEQKLAEAKQKRPEVVEVSQSLRRLQAENHFVSKIEGLITGGRRS